MNLGQEVQHCHDNSQGPHTNLHQTTASVGKSPLRALTGLRFFATAIVVAYHFWDEPASSQYGSRLYPSAVAAVTFYFILSGFILTYVYADVLDSMPVTQGALKFWRARFARIAPVYYLSLLISLPPIIYSVLVSRVSHFDASIILTPLFLQAWWPKVSTSWNGPAWSLSTECFFYLIFPFLIQPISKVPVRPLLFSAYALVCLTALIVPPSAIPQIFLSRSEFWTHFRAFFPLLHLPSFLFGIALARLYAHHQETTIRHASKLFWSTAALLISLLVLRTRLPAPFSSNLAIVPLSGALIWLGSQLDKRQMLLSTPLILLLGEASYAVYILHSPLLWWWQWLMTRIVLLPWQNIPSAIAFFVLVNMAAVAVFKWFETPLRRRILGHVENRMG